MARTLFLLLTLAALHPGVAQANPEYPGVIQTHLGLAGQPPELCNLCHAGPTMRGTVNDPFGRSLRDNGLVAGNAASLRAALDALESMGIDSDGDGIDDITELRNGTNPNVAEGEEPEEAQTFGCTAVPPASLVFALLPLLWIRRRR